MTHGRRCRRVVIRSVRLWPRLADSHLNPQIPKLIREKVDALSPPTAGQLLNLFLRSDVNSVLFRRIGTSFELSTAVSISILHLYPAAALLCRGSPITATLHVNTRTCWRAIDEARSFHVVYHAFANSRLFGGLAPNSCFLQSGVFCGTTPSTLLSR